MFLTNYKKISTVYIHMLWATMCWSRDVVKSSIRNIYGTPHDVGLCTKVCRPSRAAPRLHGDGTEEYLHWPFQSSTGSGESGERQGGSGHWSIPGWAEERSMGGGAGNEAWSGSYARSKPCLPGSLCRGGLSRPIRAAAAREEGDEPHLSLDSTAADPTCWIQLRQVSLPNLMQVWNEL